MVCTRVVVSPTPDPKHQANVLAAVCVDAASHLRVCRCSAPEGEEQQSVT